ncbi:MAG: hypothetical protein OIF56_01640 [Cohaesibacter sp.]|nr:hypothetical protein [Cohaesibacter sp.]MCV6600220.1 hypothetical protein [Cohaesibacter sp.]
MIGSVSGYKSMLMMQTLRNSRHTLEDLQRQLGTGRASQTYGGLGNDRGLALDLRHEISDLSSFQDNIQQIKTRIKVMDDALKRINGIGKEVRESARTTEYNITSEKKSMGQIAAKTLMKEMLGLLDTEINGRHLFAGKSTDTPPTLDYDQIMYGFDGKQGLIDVTNERIKADKGADGLGRLTLTNTGTNISLDETATDFGLKLNSVSNGLSNVNVTGPTGTPATLDVDVTGLPKANEELVLTFDLPGGKRHSIKLKASSSPTTLGDGSFQIGASPSGNAASLKTELEAQIKNMVLTHGEAASRVGAALDFFNTRNGAEPKRVVGTPPETATTLGTATAAGKPTVSWYVGDNGTDDPRSTAKARIDTNLEVEYGVRANEKGISRQLAFIAAYSIPEYPSEGSLDKNRYVAMTSAISGGLSINQQEQTVQTIQSELAITDKMSTQTNDRHKITKNMMKTMSDGIEGINKEEVAVKVMTLKNRMEMTYKATSILYSLSLSKYI